MTSQGHVTTASLKQANKEDNGEAFLSACISKGAAHPSLKIHTVNLEDLKSRMQQFDYNQTNSQRVINKRFGVTECWSYLSCTLTKFGRDDLMPFCG